MPPPHYPSSILILGSGVFGLSTALALSTRPSYTHTRITLLDLSWGVVATAAGATAGYIAIKLARLRPS